MRKLALRLWRAEPAQDLTEYVLLLVLAAKAAVASINALARIVNNVYSNAARNPGTKAT
jgi:Flp pilus assembly pilin Flp